MTFLLFVIYLALFEALKKYAKFEGRSNRPQYWFFALTQFLAFLILEILCLIPIVNILASIALLVLGLGLIVPDIAVTVRRLHDTNKSGWWLLLTLVPFVGGLYMDHLNLQEILITFHNVVNAAIYPASC